MATKVYTFPVGYSTLKSEKAKSHVHVIKTSHFTEPTNPIEGCGCFL